MTNPAARKSTTDPLARIAELRRLRTFIEFEEGLSIEQFRVLLDIAEAAIALCGFCKTCRGTGTIEGHHKPGFTHYETDAGEPCPAYHFELVDCPNCKGLRAAIKRLTEGQ